MSQSWCIMNFLVWIHTLATVTAGVLHLCLVTTVRAVIIRLKSRAKIRRLKYERIPVGFGLSSLRIPVSLPIPIFPVVLTLVVALPNTLLEKSGDVICYTL